MQQIISKLTSNKLKQVEQLEVGVNCEASTLTTHCVSVCPIADRFMCSLQVVTSETYLLLQTCVLSILPKC